MIAALTTDLVLLSRYALPLMEKKHTDKNGKQEVNVLGFGTTTLTAHLKNVRDSKLNKTQRTKSKREAKCICLRKKSRKQQS